MVQIYMTVRQYRTVAEIATELIADGVQDHRIHVYTAYPDAVPAIPVGVTRYRSPHGSVLMGGAVGAVIGALVGFPLLALGGFGLAPLLVLIVTGGVGGAIFRLWIGRGAAKDLCLLEDALKRGEGVMVLDIDDSRVKEIEARVKSRHPEVSVLGTDPQGTPPFP